MLGSWGYELIEVFVGLHHMYNKLCSNTIPLLIEYQYVRIWVIVEYAVKGCFKAF